MKRSISFGFMALMLAATCLFTAKPASAQIMCKDVQTTGGWPYLGYTQYCGSAPFADANNMTGVLQTWLYSGYYAGTQLANAPKVAPYTTLGAHFYLFGQASEFTTYCQTGTNYLLFGYSAASLCPTYTEPGNTISQGSSTFATVIIDNLIPASSSVGNTTAHEAGHWLDFFDGTILGGASGSRASDTPKFNSELTQDWSNLNNTALYHPCDSPDAGVFTGFENFKGAWICSSNGQGSSLNPPYNVYPKAPYTNIEAILQAAQPYFFLPTTYKPASNKELFAEENAFTTGYKDSGPSGVDGYFANSQFSCTRVVQNSLFQYGGKPVAAGVHTIYGEVGGNVVPTDMIKLTFTNSNLSPNPQSVTYQVGNNDTYSNIATGLAAAIMANTNLTSHGITATSSFNVVTSTATATTNVAVSFSKSNSESVIFTNNSYPSNQGCPVI